VVLDTETTGLDATRHQLREVAVVVLDDGLRTQRAAVWQKGDEALASFLAGFDDVAVRGIVVAHNLRFDLSFLMADARAADRGLASPPRWLCTASIGPRVPLDALANRFGVAPRRRHTADGDAETLVQTLARMVVQAEERGIDTVSGLVLVSGGGPRRVRRREAGWPAVVAGLDRVVPMPFVSAAQRSCVQQAIDRFGTRGPPTPDTLSLIIRELHDLELTALAVELVLRESLSTGPEGPSSRESDA